VAAPAVRRLWIRGWQTVAACLAVLMLVPGAAWAARPLTLGFTDTSFGTASGTPWYQRSAAAGADMVRIDIGWPVTNSATRPAGFDARNPADPHYDFSGADAAIKQAVADGLTVLVVFNGAPRWAEGPHPPASVQDGTWRPNPQAIEDYGVALATRYSGHFPDPADPGQTLPQVNAFQVWNEPNLSLYLSPQWSGGQAVAPVLYRRMLNAFYRGVKSVNPHVIVVTAGTAPFGDPPGGQRIPPVLFWRDVLCLTPAGASLRATSCPDPAHFDVLAHHPYSVGGPTNSALEPEDVSIPDLGRLTRLLRAGERLGTALPRKLHPLWITEVSYDSRPPDPQGVPVDEQARWLEQAVAELWREGAQAVFWNQVGDQAPVPSYAATSQSGVYYLNGRPKPALTAFRFPLVAWRTDSSRLEVWGRVTASGRVVVQERVGSAWKPVRTLRVRAGATFETQISASGPVDLRGVIGGQTSLVWHAS
jgi:hypothetical protein